MFKLTTCHIAWLLIYSLPVAIANDSLSEPKADPRVIPIDDPALSTFVQELTRDNPDFQAAEAATAAAEARAEAAGRPLYNPELEVAARSAIDDEWVVGFHQSVDWNGKRDTQRNAAMARHLASVASLEQSRQEATATILRKIAGYWATVEFDNLARSRSDLMHDFAQQAELRHAAGDINRLQLDLASLAFAEARMQRASTAADLAQLVRDLITFGASEEVSGWPQMPSSLPQLADRPLDVDVIIATLPEVRSARTAVDAADEDLELAKLLRRPDPRIGVFAGQEEDESLFAVSFSIPLFIRNNFSAEVLAATASRSESLAQAAAVERDVRVRVLTAMERYVLMRTAWQEWENTGAQSLQHQGDILQQMWAAREISFSDFLLQARQLIDGQTTAMALRAELWEAWIDWLEAAGLVTEWLRLDETSDGGRTEQISMRADS